MKSTWPKYSAHDYGFMLSISFHNFYMSYIYASKWKNNLKIYCLVPEFLAAPAECFAFFKIYRLPYKSMI